SHSYSYSRSKNFVKVLETPQKLEQNSFLSPEKSTENQRTIPESPPISLDKNAGIDREGRVFKQFLSPDLKIKKSFSFYGTTGTDNLCTKNLEYDFQSSNVFMDYLKSNDNEYDNNIIGSNTLNNLDDHKYNRNLKVPRSGRKRLFTSPDKPINISAMPSLSELLSEKSKFRLT
ncbi:MAG: hypothetical protein MHPSP_002705, partial [Paramarteilia canceri]